MIEDPEPIEHDELGSVESEQPSANEYREAAKKWVDFTKRCVVFVRTHNNPTLALDCWIFAMGWYDIVSADNQVELAAIHGVKKATVSFIVKKIQDICVLEPMPGQRTIQACNKFKQVRKAQLK